MRDKVAVGVYLRHARGAGVVGRNKEARDIYLTAYAKLGHHHSRKDMYAYNDIVPAAEKLFAQLIGALGVLLIQALLRQHLAHAVACAVELRGVFVCKNMPLAYKFRLCLGQKIKCVYYVAPAAVFLKIVFYRSSCTVVSAAGIAA